MDRWMDGSRDRYTDRYVWRSRVPGALAPQEVQPEASPTASLAPQTPQMPKLQQLGDDFICVLCQKPQSIQIGKSQMKSGSIHTYTIIYEYMESTWNFSRKLRICQGCEALVDEFAQNAQGLTLCRTCFFNGSGVQRPFMWSFHMEGNPKIHPLRPSTSGQIPQFQNNGLPNRC